MRQPVKWDVLVFGGAICECSRSSTNQMGAPDCPALLKSCNYYSGDQVTW